LRADGERGLVPYRLIDLFLRLEVVVERAGRERRGADDVAHGARAISHLAKDAARRLQDHLAILDLGLLALARELSRGHRPQSGGFHDVLQWTASLAIHDEPSTLWRRLRIFGSRRQWKLRGADRPNSERRRVRHGNGNRHQPGLLLPGNGEIAVVLIGQDK